MISVIAHSTPSFVSDNTKRLIVPPLEIDVLTILSRVNNCSHTQIVTIMKSIPLKKRKNASILWEHARKVFHENGMVKHIKCMHCGKAFSTASSVSRHLKSVTIMKPIPLKKIKNASVTWWDHIRKVYHENGMFKHYFHENGFFKHLKCMHCETTFSTGSSTKRHLQSIHFDHLAVCEIIKKLKDGIKRSKIQEDHAIYEETLSKWLTKRLTQDDKIVDKVNDKIQAVPEEDIDESVDDILVHGEDEDNGIDNKENNNNNINKPHKCSYCNKRFKEIYNSWVYTIVDKYKAEENRKNMAKRIIEWLESLSG